MADERAASPKRRWRDQSAGQAGTAPARRRRAVVVVLGVMLALAGAAAALVLFLRPVQAPRFLSVPIVEYTEPRLPPNPLAEQDSDALVAHFPGEAGKKAFESQQRDRLLKELDGLKGAKESAVVVHLRAHAVSRGGKVHLLPANAKLDDPATWLSLDEIIRRVRQCDAAHKLLILDVGQPIADPQLGVLVDDVSDGVQTLLEGLQADDPLVLCACSRGQVSLVSEALGRSVFAHYLSLGLAGQADGHGPGGKRDGRVTVREVAAFVRPRVDRWAQQNRATRQTPALFGDAKDFTLTQPPEGQAAPAVEPVPAEPYPGWLKAGWETRDRWWNEDAFRLAPQAFGQMEATLLRAEARWHAGLDTARAPEELAGDLKRSEERLRQARSVGRPAPPRPCSLALARAAGARTDPAPGDALRLLLAQLDQVPPPKPEEIDKAVKEYLTRFQGQAPFVELAWTGFDTLAEDHAPTAAKVRLVHGLLRGVKPPPQFVETLLIERLATWEVREWPTDAVRRLLHAARQEGQTLAGDAQALAWFGEPLRAAADRRREGEVLLFSGRLDKREQAVERLDGAERGYREVGRQADIVARARRAYDEGMALLPGYAAYLAARADLDPRDEQDWDDAVRATGDLGGLLGRAEAGPPSADDLRKPADELRRALTALRRHVRVEGLVKTAGAEGQGTPADYREVQALLEGPRLAAPDREALWLAGRRLAGRLNDATRESDEAKDGDRGAAPPADGGPARERAARRARLSLDLLRLGGLREVGALDAELAEVAAKADGAAWEGLGGKLRQAWVELLPAQLAKARDEASADRASRVLLSPEEPAAASAAARGCRRDVLAYWNWLGGHYQAESESPLFAERENYRTFYADAARDYRRGAP
jgi:hypothetical protein